MSRPDTGGFGRTEGERPITANDVVALFVELATLALLALWGLRLGSPSWAAVVLAIGLPLVAAVAWGLWAAPRARFRVPWAALLVKLVVLGAGIVAGFAVLPLGWAVVYAIVVVVNVVLMYVGPFAR